MIRDPRGQGRRLLLSQIRKSGKIARVDLARNTGISQATVTAITAELIREGLIEETERVMDGRDVRRGRPRVDLKLRGDSHRVAGIKVADSSLSVVVLDFEGRLLAEHLVQIDRRAYGTAEIVSQVQRALSEAAGIAGLRASDISGVGIGLAGFMDADNGIAHWSPSLTDRNVPLRDILQESLNIPVFLDNDVNLVAMAELYFGQGRNIDDFIVVTIESGVGAGIVIGGQLYRGARGYGGEFGHVKVQLDGALCRCGQRGCLEAYVADYALLREASVSTRFVETEQNAQRIHKLIDAARNGDATARTIIERAGRMFALGLANLVNMFDPELIIMSGERMQFDFLYAEEVMDSIAEQTVHSDMRPPEVVIHKWGDMMWAKGAAAFAIDGVAELAMEGMDGNAA
ncbi:ROK family transcriptional regulator [Qingshengfaniella alkalisoli]|uniref:ROK family transcriptional regulator n=1 Tax=Qingshengfaniella alkalisoli TaxID=2599296 RepID=A0A5B8I5B8_9RHOB|nr:ROK family transcriptional regulator [Qingshengfaniella alkalisoli]QDY68499.1 ROK family transcriptional regulator [Qingshengfaniella alkalisoli]